MDKELKFAQITAEAMIKDMRRELKKAIDVKDWQRAVDLESYIHGMEQIEIVYNTQINTMDV